MKQHRKTARPGDKQRFEQSKVLIRDTGDGLYGTFDDKHFYVKDVIIVSDYSKDPNNLKYLIGILNSKLMRFYYESTFPTLHVQRDELASLPIPIKNASETSENESHLKIIPLVDQMLTAKKQLQQSKTESDKTYLERKCETLDKQIDQIVYKLYGLTEDEIKIVEGV
jgi:hypothetical protein